MVFPELAVDRDGHRFQFSNRSLGRLECKGRGGQRRIRRTDRTQAARADEVQIGMVPGFLVFVDDRVAIGCSHDVCSGHMISATDRISLALILEVSIVALVVAGVVLGPETAEYLL